jgi:hypothetical protein
MGRGRISPKTGMSRLATWLEMHVVLTIFAIVLATALDCTRQGKKLKIAEEYTACRGVRDLVAITVATAFAASWKPLLKPNNRHSATKMMVADRMTASAAMESQ